MPPDEPETVGAGSGVTVGAGFGFVDAVWLVGDARWEAGEEEVVVGEPPPEGWAEPPAVVVLVAERCPPEPGEELFSAAFLVALWVVVDLVVVEEPVAGMVENAVVLEDGAVVLALLAFLLEPQAVTAIASATAPAATGTARPGQRADRRPPRIRPAASRSMTFSSYTAGPAHFS